MCRMYERPAWLPVTKPRRDQSVRLTEPGLPAAAQATPNPLSILCVTRHGR